MSAPAEQQRTSNAATLFLAVIALFCYQCHAELASFEFARSFLHELNISDDSLTRCSPLGSMFAPYTQSPAGPSQQPYNNQHQQQQPQSQGGGGGFNNNNGAYNWQQQSTSQQPAYGQQGGFNQSQGTWQMNGMQQQQQQQPWMNNSNGPSGFSNSGMFGNLQQNGPGLSSSAGEKRIFLPGYLNSPAVSCYSRPYTLVIYTRFTDFIASAS